MPAIAYYLLQRAIIRRNGADSALATALGSDLKGKMTMALYVAAIAIAFALPWLAHAIYVIVSLVWLIPDQRIEKALNE